MATLDATDFLVLNRGSPQLFVDTGGNDSNDGTTWALRKLTLASAITAASAGYTINVGPGTFDIASSATTLKAGVLVRGCGMGRTILTSTTLNSGGLIKPPASGKIVVQDLTINGSNSSLQAFLLDSTQVLDAIFERVELKSDFDSFYFNGSSASVSKFVGIDCEFNGSYDIFGIPNGALVFNLLQCRFRRNTLTSTNRTYGLWTTSSSSTKFIRGFCHDCDFDIEGSEAAQAMIAVFNGCSVAEFNLINCTCNVRNAAAGGATQINSSASGGVRVSGGTWNRALCYQGYSTDLIFNEDVAAGVMFRGVFSGATTTTAAVQNAGVDPSVPTDSGSWVDCPVVFEGAVNQTSIIRSQSYDADNGVLNLTFDAVGTVPSDSVLRVYPAGIDGKVLKMLRSGRQQ